MVACIGTVAMHQALFRLGRVRRIGGRRARLACRIPRLSIKAGLRVVRRRRASIDLGVELVLELTLEGFGLFARTRSQTIWRERERGGQKH